MSNSLVVELQKLASDSDVEITVLLRKTLLIAEKLNQQQIVSWVKNEMNGYDVKLDLPDYRKTRGRLYGVDYCGTKSPFEFQTKEDELFFTSYNFRDPISLICNLLEEAKENKRGFVTKYNDSYINKKMIKSGIVNQPISQMCLHIPVSCLNVIINQVIDNILGFSIELEKRGVLGEGFTFDIGEKNIATQFIINMNGSGSLQIQNDTNNSTQRIENTSEE